MSQTLSEAKLRHWMQRLGPGLIALSAGICRDRHAAEEIVQEAFVKLWKRPPDAGEVAFSSWLRRVVTNLSINALQRTRRPSTLPRVAVDPALHREDDRRQRELREEVDRVRRAMDQLDESKRAILMLRGHEQLTYDEIARHLGIPVGTVMSRLNRARTALMEAMRRNEEASDEDEEAVYEFRKYRQG